MWLTIDEIATYLKISKETIYKMVQQNQLPASKLGNQWRFNREMVDNWLISQSNFNQIQKKASNE
jgi:excisionase family DNA binding protein